jgi:hypothetical protein
MTRSLILAAVLTFALSACGRPQEVRSVASAALPVATNLQASAQKLQSRFAAQRATLDSRNAELALQAGLARDQSHQIEQDWKFQGETGLPKSLALYREGDGPIIADPLAPVSATAPGAVSKPQAHDMSALGNVVKGFSELRAERGPDARELFAFFVSANEKLKEIETEKNPDNSSAAPE